MSPPWGGLPCSSPKGGDQGTPQLPGCPERVVEAGRKSLVPKIGPASRLPSALKGGGGI